MTVAPAAEATTEPGGELLVITPWYPNPDNPYAGAFVRESVRALAPYYRHITIVHVENRPSDDTRGPVWRDSPEGRVLWIGVPMDPMTSRADMMLAQREALTKHARQLIDEAAVIHCHVGAPTAAALTPLLRQATRVVVTEHATYLTKIFRDPTARDLYRAAYTRADMFTTVSAVTAGLIESTFPDARDHVTIVANPVPLENLPVKTELNPLLSRWLYVGNLTEHKGVRRLVRSFAAWVAASEDDTAHLTLVGAGPLRDDLADLAAQLNVAERVEFRGAIEPDQMGAVYLEHDVLVHLSHIETFGLTSVEAAACGLPVLVTYCGGPEETLAVHAALGLAAYIPLGDEHDTGPVLAAGFAVQRTLDPSAIPMSRAHLERSYGARAVGAKLHAALAGLPMPAPVPVPGMRALGVAITRRQAEAAEASLRYFASLGGSGVYLAGRPVTSALPDAIRVIDISGVEQQAPLSWLRRPAEALRPGAYDKLWRNVGPAYVAWRLDKAGIYDALDLGSFDCFVLPDVFATPFGYRAAQHNPRLDINLRWTPQAIATRYVTHVLRTERHKRDAKLDQLLADAQLRVAEEGGGVNLRQAANDLYDENGLPENR